MQVYLQYKYYITVTKTGDAIPQPWIRSAEVQGERRYENGNTTTTQQPRQALKSEKARIKDLQTHLYF